MSDTVQESYADAERIRVKPGKMPKSRVTHTKLIEVAPGEHVPATVAMRKLEKRIVRLVAKAIIDFKMLADGDKVMVCMSGGKDSYVLLDALLRLQKRAPIRFSVVAVHIAQGIPGAPTEKLEEWLKMKGADYHIEYQDTYSVVQKLIPDGRNVCSLCARLRRGIIYTVAARLGCTKIALGHQMDDVVSTLLLNMFFGSGIKAMPPVLRSDDKKNVVIRPLIYLREHELRRWAQICNYPLFPKDLCGAGENLQRKEIKTMLREWDRQYDSRVYNLFMSTMRVSPSQLADKTLYDFENFRRIGQAPDEAGAAADSPEPPQEKEDF